MDDAATCFEYYGGLATKINGEVLPVPDDAIAFAMREPIGVAGQIIPWNYPLLMAAWKIAPGARAPAARCVLKPAEQTPLSILKLAEDFEAVGTAARRGQHRHRATAPARARRWWRIRDVRQDRLHRQRRGRQAHHAERRRPAQADLARAGRQVAQHLLRRRRLRERGRRRAVRRLHQPGRGLLGREPRAGAAGHLQEVRRRRGGQGQDHPARPRASTATPRWARW